MPASPLWKHNLAKPARLSFRDSVCPGNDFFAAK